MRNSGPTLPDLLGRSSNISGDRQTHAAADGRSPLHRRPTSPLQRPEYSRAAQDTIGIGQRSRVGPTRVARNRSGQIVRPNMNRDDPLARPKADLPATDSISPKQEPRDAAIERPPRVVARRFSALPHVMEDGDHQIPSVLEVSTVRCRTTDSDLERTSIQNRRRRAIDDQNATRLGAHVPNLNDINAASIERLDNARSDRLNQEFRLIASNSRSRGRGRLSGNMAVAPLARRWRREG